MPTTLLPGRPVPAFDVPLVGGGAWSLSAQSPKTFTLIEFYRGRHCPRCHRHLLALAGLLPRFADRGVEAVAISMDGAERAEDAHKTWGLGDLRVGYGLTLETAEALGLFISNPITEREPGPFNEPASLWVRPDGTLFAANYGTTPFSRPHWPDWLEALDAIIARDYPPRGDRAPAS
ncbi:MAG: redoxin domain-containing protein [Pseudomonadota bacterium]